MIVVRLSGGLGNQLFQYATGRGVAARAGAELVLDLQWFGERYRQTSERPYELDRYPVRARLLQPGELRRHALYTHPVLKRLPLGPLRGPLRLVRESRPQFDVAVLDAGDRTYLDGYWQSPRYFEAIAADIRREATPSVAMRPADRDVAEHAAATDSVAVHVRRGDYVAVAAAAKAHGTLSPDYYRRAAEAIAGRVASPTYFVFSDDPEWAQRNLAFDAPVRHVTHNSPADAFQDLRLMAACRHQIVANSSLSWWGAWLNPNPSKIVVAPRPWFQRGDPRDLVPGAWTRVAR